MHIGSVKKVVAAIGIIGIIAGVILGIFRDEARA